MKSPLHLAGIALLAFTLACTQQRASEDQSRASGDTRGGADVTAPADDRALADTSQLTQDDRTFVQEAAQGGKAEVELAQLGQEKSQNDQVKQLAQQIHDDHQKANDELMRIAQAKSIQLDQAQPKREHQQAKQRLSQASGAKFDQLFLQTLLQHHKEDIAKFRTQSTKTNDAALKDFTSRTFPTLENHLLRIQEVQGQL
jgi:putative membrane protein